ncbi:MAG: hypothetical protein RL398_1058 [Planctomycetota bacterium]|jgi:arylsulfatase A-like enzyme
MHWLRPLAWLVAVGLIPVACTVSPKTARPPNVLVIVVDDLGAMDVGPNNPDCAYDTPNLDRLAARSMRFTNGYAACPVCSPTRYSLMTGRYPTRAGATDYFGGNRVAKFVPAKSVDRMPLEEVTIAEALRERGYATFFAGKWHLGPTEEFWPERQGFDINRGGHDRGGPYGGNKYFSPYQNPRLADGPAGEHLPERLARETAQFVAEHRDEPFLAYLAFYSVHTPLMARPDLKAKYEARFGAAKGNEAEADFADEEQVWPVRQPRRVRIRQNHAVYAAMVEAMDEAVGVVLAELDRQGLTDNTLVVFTSDNGGLSTSEGSPTSNLPLRGGKGWLYEGGIRVPWLIAGPGVQPGATTCDTPISSIDLLPTVLDVVGAPSREVDGVSLAPLLRGEPIAERPLFWHYPHYGNQGGFPAGVVRMGNHKLIERLEDGEVALYDLANDPSERRDVTKAEMGIAVDLRRRLHAFYQEQNASFLQPKDGRVPWRPEQSSSAAGGD